MANLVPKNDGTFSFWTKLGESLLEKKFSKDFAQVSWYRNGGLLPADKTVVQTRGNRHSLLLQQVVTN